MKAKLWGVRGSLPSPLPPQVVEQRIREALKQAASTEDIDAVMSSLSIERCGGYGGNTACVEVFNDDTSVIIDGGSGIRRKGYELMDGPCGKGTGDVHILMTHLHWDHVIGFPFFVPLFVPGNTIHLYSVQPETEETFRVLFRKPNFPVSYDMLGATIIYHRLEPRVKRTIGSLSVTPYQLDHPDPCWGYRIEHGGRSLAYCVDTECTRASSVEMGDDLPLYHNADTMIFDAQYTLLEALEKVNWGHAAATIGLDIAFREGIGKVVFMHHDPAASDERIADARNQTAEYLKYQYRGRRDNGMPHHEVTWCFAHEEMIVEI